MPPTDFQFTSSRRVMEECRCVAIADTPCCGFILFFFLWLLSFVVSIVCFGRSSSISKVRGLPPARAYDQPLRHQRGQQHPLWL